jgi:hypothetical protein
VTRDPPMRPPQPPIPKPAKLPPLPESRIRPGCETPAISAGADAARLALSPRRKVLHQSKHLKELAASGIAHPRFHQPPKAMNAFGELPAVEWRSLVERIHLALAAAGTLIYMLFTILAGAISSASIYVLNVSYLTFQNFTLNNCGTSTIISEGTNNTIIVRDCVIQQVGQTLTAGNGSWSGNPTSFTYQWFNSSTGSIHGQTSSTYVAEVGDQRRVAP